MSSGDQSALILTTALVSLITGYGIGIFATRGYIVSPALAEERYKNKHDPVESDESDIDEDDTILDHAPNWVNGSAADRRQGLSAANSKPVINVGKEECKLVLVVRTDLGMTKGTYTSVHLAITHITN